MKTLELEFTTHELQLAVIACISGKYDKSSTTSTEENQTIMDALIEKLGKMNQWCFPGNDFTIKVTVTP